MLSISPLKSASAASHYFEKDNYYAKDSSDAKEMSEWWGQCAAALGLHGNIESTDFLALLEGKLPNDEQLGVIKSGENQHRAGYDLTFSAPKSVSLLLAFAGDTRLLEAHQFAVKQALSVIEQEAANTRIKKEGEIAFLKTGNLAVAQFHHDSSRALDPQLHTHAVVLNMTEREDGKFRSLGSQTQASIQKDGLQGFSEQVFHHKKTYGMIYRAALAEQVKSLGYEIVQTKSHGFFEIAGVPQSLIETFSKRREAIVTAMADLGLEGGKQAAYATLLTRAAKQDLSREEIQAYWQAQSKDAALETIVHTAKTNPIHPLSLSDQNKRAIQSLHFAIAHLSERNAVFSQADLLKTALQQGLGNINFSHVVSALQHLSHEGKFLIQLPSQQNSLYYTTPAMLALEKENIALMHAGKAQLSPILSPEKAAFLLKDIGFTAGQKAAAQCILTTCDKVSGIQGYAGTGKTTLLKSVKSIAEQSGYTLMGICPTSAAANKLQAETGIASQTLANFLLRPDLPANSEKTVFIVDEASMASNKSANALLQLNQNQPTRLILLGDKQQLAAVEAGKPFEQLQKAGMTTVVMKDIVRQKAESDMKIAVEAAISGHIQSSLQHLTEVKEIEAKDERLSAIAAHYLSLSSAERAETLLITPANDDRKILNHKVRAGLQSKQEIDSKETVISSLQNKGLTQVEKTKVSNYALSDLIRFNKASRVLGIESGAYYQVTGIHPESNTLTLTNEKQEILSWKAHGFGARSHQVVEVFQSMPLAISKGEMLRFTRNIKADGLVNAEKAIVMQIQKDKVTVQLQNGKTVTLDSKQAQHRHVDYAYSLTAHAAQGESYKQVIAHDESFRKQLTDQRAFYVIISRAKEAVYLYTDDKAAYLKQLESQTGEKPAALDLLPTDKQTATELSAPPHPLSMILTDKPLSSQTEKDFNATTHQEQIIDKNPARIKENPQLDLFKKESNSSTANISIQPENRQENIHRSTEYHCTKTEQTTFVHLLNKSQEPAFNLDKTLSTPSQSSLPFLTNHPDKAISLNKSMAQEHSR